MPTISVVVPCYNGGKFLDQLQACLARQTFRDFEIVVVDDGSTDSLTKEKFALLELVFLCDLSGKSRLAGGTQCRHFGIKRRCAYDFGL